MHFSINEKLKVILHLINKCNITLSFFYQMKQNIITLDLTHPGLEDSLFHLHSFFDTCIDYLKIYNYSINNKVQSETMNYLFKIIKNHDSYKLYDKLICNKSCCRFYKSDIIKSIRSQKKNQKIQLDFIYKNLTNLWDNQPSSFSEFKYGLNPYQTLIDYAFSVSQKYKEIDAEFLSIEVENDIKNFIQNHAPYYGFNKLKINLCAVILAKKNNFYIKDGKIYVLFNDEIECQYSPILYNVEYSSIDISKEILEYNLELNNKSIFDHYWILHPSFYDKGRCISEEMFLEDIEKRMGNSILIGEADSKSYFICEI